MMQRLRRREMRLPVFLSILTIVAITPIASACEMCRGAGADLHRLPLPSSSVGGGVVVSGGGGPLSVPALSSRPGARAKLYLDFDGDFSTSWGSYSPGTTPAYTTDADATTFTSSELITIDHIWQGVAEKFSPFDLDVTTVDPGALNEQQGYRLVVGGTGSWYGLAGGVAYLGGFSSDSAPNTAFVFSANLLPADPLHASFVTAASAHEAGHGFSLTHQSKWNGNQYVEEYNRGDAFKAPIMGSSYRKRGIWWRGPTFSPTVIQDDLITLSDLDINGFGYRSDDHANTADAATPLSQDAGIWSATGVIEQRTDVDYFSFDFTGGMVNFVLAVAPYEAMLDAAMSLYNLSGDLILSRDTATLGESFMAELPAGSYRLAVTSHRSYGDIGQFSLTGIVAIPEPGVLGASCLTFAALAGRRWVRSGSKNRPIN